MRDLIGFSYNINTDSLTSHGEILFTTQENTYIYIIPVGREKNSTFFHLLKFIDASNHFKHVFTVDQAPTLLIRDIHFYCLASSINLHQTISQAQLNLPVIYEARYPLASHFKTKWLQKNQIHEDNLNLALDKTPLSLRSVLFDLATYYIHLNEEAYRLLAPLEKTLFSTSLSHARVKPDTPLYEFFMPDYLILDNKSRVYCEYLRHLFLKHQDLDLIKQVVAHMVKTQALLEEEWHFLYARLYFPTHFYDVVYDIVVNGLVKIDELYEQTMNYSQLLFHLPQFLNYYTGIILDVPSWVKSDMII